MSSAITISIDLELAWGNWDNVTRGQLERVEGLERGIVNRLVEILDRHQVPATWAVVAALLDPKSAEGRPGPERCWYAPDVIDTIRSAAVRHDLGSHGGRHVYLDRISKGEAEDDFAFAGDIHSRNGIQCRSFVFPRNRIGHKDLLARHRFKVFRGQDRAWHERIRVHNTLAGRAANLLDKLLPIRPEPALPRRESELIDLPGSMLFMSRNGLRRMALPSVMRHKLGSGIRNALKCHGVFHLWFHPSNFYYQAASQFALFESFVAQAAKLSRQKQLSIRTMAAYADD